MSGYPPGIRLLALLLSLVIELEASCLQCLACLCGRMESSFCLISSHHVSGSLKSPDGVTDHRSQSSMGILRPDMPELSCETRPVWLQRLCGA